MSTLLRRSFLLVVIALFIPGVALAYGGPGSVISGIGALLAAIAAILASLFGFIWFPLKRLYRNMTEEDAPTDETPAKQTAE